MRLSVLFHLPILPPKMPECEAISQEIAALMDRFGGEIVYVNPNHRSPVYVPRALFGFHRLGGIRRRESDLDLHHLYNPDPFPFPYLRFLRRPVVYSLTGGVTHRPNLAFFASLTAVTVADEGSLERLRGWGLENVFRVHPGIDVDRFTHSPLPLRSEVRLMVGSAPWTKRQFRSKGVLALLEAARREPRLRLVFLWRGVLAEEMARHVRAMGVQDRVTVLNRQVDVDRVLADVHASIALAETPALIRAYPHSLMESLAAGKPILVSRAIPMATYAEQTGCGKVVEEVTADSILTAVDALVREYDALQRAARQVGKRDFPLQAMLDSIEKVYAYALETASA